VRGSPVLRFILLAIALVITAAGLQRVTSAKAATNLLILPERTRPAASTVPFRLMLSATAASVEINASKPLHLAPDETPISGTLEMDPANPHVALIIQWKNPPSTGERRFAKLTLEPPRQPTFTHVFDADGDIDDFLELPFPLPHE
jgi:hypothetical protein